MTLLPLWWWHLWCDLAIPRENLPGSSFIADACNQLNWACRGKPLCCSNCRKLLCVLNIWFSQVFWSKHLTITSMHVLSPIRTISSMASSTVPYMQASSEQQCIFREKRRTIVRDNPSSTWSKDYIPSHPPVCVRTNACHRKGCWKKPPWTTRVDSEVVVIEILSFILSQATTILPGIEPLKLRICSSFFSNFSRMLIIIVINSSSSPSSSSSEDSCKWTPEHPGKQTHPPMKSIVSPTNVQK